MSAVVAQRWLIVAVVCLTACSPGTQSASDSAPEPGAPQVTTTSIIEEYPDSITRTIERLARAPRPVPNSAMPPRHLDADRFPRALVDRERIVSGGPPPDGIPPIDRPRFDSPAATDWIEPNEPVMVVTVGSAVHIYPLQVMTWHEVVNDVVDGVPVVATYCPLCNSGIVYERTVDGDVVDFGTSGSLYQANLVLYDRQSESLWTQFDGRAVVGDRVEQTLRPIPASTASWADAIAAHPDALVLQRDTENPRPYGRNPYGAYDSRDRPLAGFFTGEPDGTLPPFDRVVGIELDGQSIAVRTADVARDGVIALDLGGRSLTVWHRPGTASALDAADIAAGADVGATGVFIAEIDGAPVEFAAGPDGIVDTATGSEWNIFGQATAGPLTGVQLERVDHVDTFWFSWAAFRVTPALFVVEP